VPLCIEAPSYRGFQLGESCSLARKQPRA
jgi:hypothetical protein